jgi:RimJ/RimL family protein N-acetyltransferase
MEFTTRRLEVKKVIREYIPIMFEIWDRENEVGKYIPDYDPNWTLETFTEHIVNTFRSDLYDRGVIKLKDGEIIGYASVYQEDSRSKSVNIYIAKDYWGHGYGHEVLSAIVRRCKKEGLGSVYATCDSRNVGAIKILERDGFECIDKIPGDRVDVNGEVGDELLYELELIRVQY